MSSKEKDNGGERGRAAGKVTMWFAPSHCLPPRATTFRTLKENAHQLNEIKLKILQKPQSSPNTAVAGPNWIPVDGTVAPKNIPMLPHLPITLTIDPLFASPSHLCGVGG